MSIGGSSSGGEVAKARWPLNPVTGSYVKKTWIYTSTPPYVFME
jgi:hypothetical protein